MRRGVMQRISYALRHMGRRRPAVTSSGTSPAGPPAADLSGFTGHLEYSPCIDGDPDPGEVVWTWVPYEEDPTQGKDRPVAIIGRRGSHLLGVPLTSRQNDDEEQVAVGAGPWDRDGRPSFAKIERLLDVAPEQVRREGSVLPKRSFDAIVAGLARVQRARPPE